MQLILRGEQGSVHSTRTIAGTPYRIGKSADGRERVTLRVAEGTDQIALIERVLRVVAAPIE